MAQQSDWTNKLINIAIVAAIITGLWFLWKMVKGGGGFGLFGGGGDKIGLGGAAGGGNAADGHAESVASKIENAIKKDFHAPTKVMRIGYELDLANKVAKPYTKKQGNNIVINKTLKAVNALNDTDFIASINAWQELAGFSNMYDTDLATALIPTQAHSIFLTRYGVLTGQITKAKA